MIANNDRSHALLHASTIPSKVVLSVIVIDFDSNDLLVENHVLRHLSLAQGIVGGLYCYCGHLSLGIVAICSDWNACIGTHW
jgi:hypothetical protein